MKVRPWQIHGRRIATVLVGVVSVVGLLAPTASAATPPNARIPSGWACTGGSGGNPGHVYAKYYKKSNHSQYVQADFELGSKRVYVGDFYNNDRATRAWVRIGGTWRVYRSYGGGWTYYQSSNPTDRPVLVKVCTSGNYATAVCSYTYWGNYL